MWKIHVAPTFLDGLPTRSSGHTCHFQIFLLSPQKWTFRHFLLLNVMFLPLDLLWLEEKQREHFKKALESKNPGPFIFAFIYGLWPFWGWEHWRVILWNEYLLSCGTSHCRLESAGFWLRLNSKSKIWTENRLSGLYWFKFTIILLVFGLNFQMGDFEPGYWVSDCFLGFWLLSLFWSGLIFSWSEKLPKVFLIVFTSFSICLLQATFRIPYPITGPSRLIQFP